MRTESIGRVAVIAMACVGALPLVGCYRYSYVERNGPDLQAVAIDRNLPTSKVSWSLFWGIGKEPVWEPVACLQLAADGSCEKQIPLCDAGVGAVDVQTPGYALPLALVTIGIVMPMKTTLYCATSRPSGTPPIGP